MNKLSWPINYRSIMYADQSSVLVQKKDFRNISATGKVSFSTEEARRELGINISWELNICFSADHHISFNLSSDLENSSVNNYDFEAGSILFGQFSNLSSARAS